MILPPKSSHLTSFQVIENTLFNLVSVIQYAINRVGLQLDVLPNLYYSPLQSYRDLWRHR